MKQLFEYICGLNEMAYERKRFIEILDKHTSQIVQNWCLVWYASKTNNINKNHWASEFIAQIQDMGEMNLKKHNSTEQRKKTILHVWNNEREFNTSDNAIFMCIITKFKKENISPEWTKRAICSFRMEIDKLAELIAKNDMIEVHSYIESLISHT